MAVLVVIVDGADVLVGVVAGIVVVMVVAVAVAVVAAVGCWLLVVGRSVGRSVEGLKG